MSESSLIVIVLSSLVYPYFKLDIEQDEISRQNDVVSCAYWENLVLVVVPALESKGLFFLQIWGG